MTLSPQPFRSNDRGSTLTFRSEAKGLRPGASKLPRPSFGRTRPLLEGLAITGIGDFAKVLTSGQGLFKVLARALAVRPTAVSSSTL